jgi:response regulator of citrate/malate metabolism
MKRSVFAGPFEYILKPFTRKELQSAVEASLQKRQVELQGRTMLQR